MSEDVSENRLNQWVGLLFVLAVHGALLYAAVSYKLIPPPQEAVTLMVSLINPPKKEEPPPPPPPEPPKPTPPKEVKLVKEKPVELPKPAPVVVAQAPVESLSDSVAPPPPAEPVKEAPPAPLAPVVEAPAGPVNLSELSLACPQRSEPNYPAVSRRKGEQGQVRLRVELDEAGNVTSVKVAQSSGYKRLDDAGITAVKTWQCNPAMRDGKTVRAVALQPFNFILEGE